MIGMNVYLFFPLQKNLKAKSDVVGTSEASEWKFKILQSYFFVSSLHFSETMW